MRREPLLAAAPCLLGAFLVLVAAGRGWVLVDVAGGPLLPDRQVPVTGADLAPGLRALGLVGLAGIPALAAVRRRGRVAVGVVLLAVGLGVLAVVLQLAVGGLADAALRTDALADAGGAGADGAGARAGLTAWPAATALGGLLLALSGLLVAVRGRHWSGLGRRYDAPAAREVPVAAEPDAAVVERDLWEALDRGEDPTAPPGVRPDPGAR